MTSSVARPFFPVCIVLFLCAAANAQLPNEFYIQHGGFSYLTGFGNTLENLEGIGYVPSPIFTRFSSVGLLVISGGPIPLSQIGVRWDATESIRKDPTNTSPLLIEGTLTSGCIQAVSGQTVADCLSGTYTCHSQLNNFSNQTLKFYTLDCDLTITGGTGFFQGRTGKGDSHGLMQLFPMGSLVIVQLSNRTTHISLNQ